MQNNNIRYLGTQRAKQLGEWLVESGKMPNSGDSYTKVLAEALWCTSYSDFAKYFKLTQNFTPTSLGVPNSGGPYELPTGHVVGPKTCNIATGISEPESILKCSTMLIEKFVTDASNKVLRDFCTGTVNYLVSGAVSENTQTGGISSDNIAEACKAINDAKDSNGKKFGFNPDYIACSYTGWCILSKSDDFKQQFLANNNHDDQIVWNNKTIMATPLTVKKNSKDVHAIVLDSNHLAASFRNTDMDTFDGQILEAGGNRTEIIHSIEAVMVILNAKAGAVITA